MKPRNKRKLTVKNNSKPIFKKRKFEETSNQYLQRLFSHREELQQCTFPAFQKKSEKELKRIESELEIINQKIATISSKINEEIYHAEDSGLMFQHSLTFSKFATGNATPEKNL
jgi:glutaredoxin 2